MLIDGIAAALLLLALFKGLRKGLVLAFFSFIAVLVGLAAAVKLSATVAGYLGQNISVSERWLPVLAFALVFVLVAWLVRLGARLIEGTLEAVALGWLNRLGGFLFFALLYLFVFSLLLFYATQLQLLRPQAGSSSLVYEPLLRLAPRLVAGLGWLLPFFRDMFGALEGFFGGLSQPEGTAAGAAGMLLVQQQAMGANGLFNRNPLF